MTMPNSSNYGAVAVDEDHHEHLNARAEEEFDQGRVTFARNPTRLARMIAIGAMIAVVAFLSSQKDDQPTAFLVGSAVVVRRPEDVFVAPQAFFYHHQKVDHFDKDNTETWSNRYYKSTKFFKGSGHPIFMIVGGEGAMDDGFFYPFISQVLAKRFSAAVLQIEHRFYGPYVPIENATNSQLEKLLTPAQAMADMVQLTRHVRDTEFVGCSPHRSSPDYCPIITVGGSYPGFLSAMFRIVHPNFADISYASSAPLLMYAQLSDQDSYYDIVTRAADRVSPGCSTAVRSTMDDIVFRVQAADTLQHAAESVGVCPDRIPTYIRSKDMLSDALVQISSYAFADYDMSNYPPGPNTEFFKACSIFQKDGSDGSSTEKLSLFLQTLPQEQPANVWDNEHQTTDSECFDLMTQLPDGPNSTLDDTAGDYEDGKMWDFQTCTNVVFLCGFSNTSLFPPHKATMSHLTHHCRERFGVTPRPTEMVDEWNYVRKLKDTSHLLFVNGMQDMWAGGSVLTNISDTVVAINIDNGAHHSDLSHRGPSPNLDTPDVIEAFVQIETLLAKWLKDIQASHEE